MSLEPVIVQMSNAGDNAPKAMLYYGQDCRKSFRQLPAGSVHTICTSPPYWGLRDYGNDPSIWGGDESCDHEWVQHIQPATDGTLTLDGNAALRAGNQGDVSATMKPKVSNFCSKCNAWMGQLGLEPTPDLFVEHLVEIFREARRVLQDDGVLWVNLGDSYAAGCMTGKQGSTSTTGHNAGQAQGTSLPPRKAPAGMKNKDLVGIPWMTAFALRADGWYFRQDIVWAKANVMPESVFDRCTRSHEFVFMFTKKQMYYYDYFAIRENAIGGVQKKAHSFKQNHRLTYQNADGTPRGNDAWINTEGKRNKRSVWNVNPKPYAGAHFAVWPEKLVEPMILAGSSERGCCSKCKAPYERIVDKPQIPDGDGEGFQGKFEDTDDNTGGKRAMNNAKAWRDAGMPHDAPFPDPVERGWEPTCDCGVEIERCIVLDPFSGSATTGLVALKNGRDYIGFDANAVYQDLAQARLENRAAPNIHGNQDAPNEGTEDGTDSGVYNPLSDLFG